MILLLWLRLLCAVVSSSSHENWCTSFRRWQSLLAVSKQSSPPCRQRRKDVDKEIGLNEADDAEDGNADGS